MKCPCGKDHSRGAKTDPTDVASQEFRRIRAMVEPENVPGAYQEDNPHPVYAAAFPRCRQGDHRDGQTRATARVRYTENGREAWTTDMCDRHAALSRERFIREGRRGVEIMPAGWTPPPSRRAAEARRWELMGDAHPSQAHLYAYEMSTDLATPPVIQARPGWGSSDMADAFVQQAGGRPWVVPDVNAFLANTYQPEAEAAHRFLMQERALMTPVPVPGDPRRNR